ncbi:hypothetical protein Pla144_23690 [Bythopirellula polymerisocia]|uniref:Uncharacterized protein n=2 Tax=Bythopirellula polymerisocia TaxID=2528003 RepID=A0A5C6CST5_9BACT|nr:hypothetical protein Pla144_23690 [Bythopirellula polymerisocia]
MVFPMLSYGPLAICADYHISTQADFDTYKQATFSPGDNILFERGKVFTGMFAPTTVGNNGRVITISSYGTGAKPVINNNGVIHPHPTRNGKTVSAGVFLFNAEYVDVKNLEITNNNGGDQTENLFGIYVLGEDTGKYHNHIYIENNYVHNVNGAVAGKKRGGIHIHGYSPTTAKTATYNDVRIVNNVVDRVGGVGIGSEIDDVVNANSFVGTHRENAMTNLYVAHNWIGNTGRNSVIARDSDYAVYEYNTSANSSRYDTGHSFFNFRTLGMTFQYNEAYGNTGVDNDPDRGGFDADFNSKDTVIQYNYSHGNNWFAGIMKKPNTDVTIRYNLSVNEEKGAYFYGFENNDDLTGLNIYNNTHYFDGTISPEIIARDRTPIETTFYNNIFYAVGTGSMGTNANNGTKVTYDTNVYHNITPPASETNGLIQNPLFFSPGAEPQDVDMEFGRDVLAGYMLSADSPYLNNGVSISSNGGLDFWGNALPNGDTDIGASEYRIGTVVSPAVTVFTGNLFPASNNANVVAATPDAVSITGDDAAVSLTQTFQVTSAFNLKTIFLDYEYDAASDPNDILINLEIFEVADVAASSIKQGRSFLTLNGQTLSEIAGADVAAIILDSAVTLSETTGTTGYALRITNGGSPGFEWHRTGSSSGSVYSFGQAYEDGVEKYDGQRDFVLALSDVDVSLPVNADFDADGDVDGADFLIWQRGFGTSGAHKSDGDADNDHDVDQDDLTLWKNQYGNPVPLSSATAVPEPSSLSACLMSTVFACRWFRRINTSAELPDVD